MDVVGAAGHIFFEPQTRPAHFLNNGSTVIQAITGKKIMGTVRPGNNSGNGVVSGSVIAMGMITHAKEPTL